MNYWSSHVSVIVSMAIVVLGNNIIMRLKYDVVK